MELSGIGDRSCPLVRCEHLKLLTFKKTESNSKRLLIWCLFRVPNSFVEDAKLCRIKSGEKNLTEAEARERKGSNEPRMINLAPAFVFVFVLPLKDSFVERPNRSKRD